MKNKFYWFFGIGLLDGALLMRSADTHDWVWFWIQLVAAIFGGVLFWLASHQEDKTHNLFVDLYEQTDNMLNDFVEKTMPHLKDKVDAIRERSAQIIKDQRR